MQTLSVFLLQHELPEIEEIISTMDDVEILQEQKVPDSDLVQVTFYLSDPSVLYTIGLLVGIERVKKISDKHFKDLKL